MKSNILKNDKIQGNYSTMEIIDNILDFVFPTYCISCGKRQEDFCVDCLVELRRAERECEKWIFPIFDYREPKIKKTVLLLKYKSKKRLAKIIAAVMRDRILEELSELEQFSNFTDPILIPIPLSKKRLRKRGYNQTELICKHLSHNVTGLNCLTGVLIKTRETKRQAIIKDRRKRLKNLVGSFGVKNKELIRHRNIILIDDVTTTGATLKEAKKVLKNNGARKVVAFTFAH
jgi:competence protein ComFC